MKQSLARPEPAGLLELLALDDAASKPGSPHIDLRTKRAACCATSASRSQRRTAPPAHLHRAANDPEPSSRARAVAIEEICARSASDIL